MTRRLRVTAWWDIRWSRVKTRSLRCIMACRMPPQQTRGRHWLEIRMKHYLVIMVLVVCWAGVAQAQDADAGVESAVVVPVGDDVRRWLAVAFIAEAGWADRKRRKAEADHRGVFHVLRGRFTRMNRRLPKRYPTFLSVVQGYVAAFDTRTPKGGRVRWLLALAFGGRTGEPAGWPADVRWDVHQRWWEATLERAGRCLAGRCKDPYRGKARHWGGAMDSPQGCMRELPNVGTYNTFYSVDLECRRRVMRRKGSRNGRVDKR